ncbi:MAG: hypothetical protein ACI8UP_004251, partial [Porticoccaceae bacterium]
MLNQNSPFSAVIRIFSPLQASAFTAVRLSIYAAFG